MDWKTTFEDRHDAGRQLARALLPFRGKDVVVLGLPRGGVPVGAEVAKALDAPLDVLVVRKLGVPWQPELGFGAVGPGGLRVLNDPLLRSLELAPAQVEEVARREEAERARRERRYRGDRPFPTLEGRVAVVVDDGIATGFTARAGVEAARALGAARVVLAAPVAPPDAVASLGQVADDVVCLRAPEHFHAVGEAYRRFDQVADEEVVAILASHRPAPAATRAPATTDTPATPAPTAAPAAPTAPIAPATGIPRVGPGRRGTDPAAASEEQEVRIEALPGVELPGSLTVPPGATGLVVFVHGSGSGRASPRNTWVARRMGEEGLATLLVDLLAPREAEEDARTGEFRFDIPLLTARVVGIAGWLARNAQVRSLPVGLYGSSTGAAAALAAAARMPDRVQAVVSRGGRPDLVADALPNLRAPVLFLVGSRDAAVLRLHHDILPGMRAPARLHVVDGAGHLFEEPGTLEEVAGQSADWFVRHLGAVRARAGATAGFGGEGL